MNINPDDFLRERSAQEPEIPIDKLVAAAEVHGTLTEADVADVFVATALGRILFNHTEKKWFIWVGSHWQRNETALAYEAIRRLVQANSAELPPGLKARVRSASFARGVEAFARADSRVSVTALDFDRDPDLLGTPGGTVELRTGILRPADPKDRISKITSVTPRAGTCARWTKFLKESTGGDEAMIKFLQEWGGYSLTGHANEEQLVFMHGTGGNGKGTFLHVLNAIINDYAVTMPVKALLSSDRSKGTNDIADLKGARFVTAQEPQSGQKWDQQVIKTLTGNDRLNARRLYENNVEFPPQFSLTMSGNHAPALDTVDDADRRRINVVPFTHKPPKVDKTLKARLVPEEGPQILHWLIEGAKRWYADGLTKPEAVTMATEQYFDEQDAFQHWFDDECRIDPTASEHLDKLYRFYVESLSGAARKPMSKRAISKRLENVEGLTKDRDQYGIKFKGVRLYSSDLR